MGFEYADILRSHSLCNLITKRKAVYEAILFEYRRPSPDDACPLILVRSVRGSYVYQKVTGTFLPSTEPYRQQRRYTANIKTRRNRLFILGIQF